MTSNLESNETGTAETVVLRAPDGVWYKVPIADLEWTRISDPAQLEDLHSQVAARGSAERAALERDAAAVADKDDVVGFTNFGDGDFQIFGTHRQWEVWKTSTDPSGNNTSIKTTLLLAPPKYSFPGQLSRRGLLRGPA